MFFYSIFRLLKSPLVLARKLVQGREWHIIHYWQERYSMFGAKLWAENHKFYAKIGDLTLGGGV